MAAGVTDAPPEEDELEGEDELEDEAGAVAAGFVFGFVLCAFLWCFFVCLAVVVVFAATVAVEWVLLELLPQPATATTAATAERERIRRITARVTTGPCESFGNRQRFH